MHCQLVSSSKSFQLKTATAQGWMKSYLSVFFKSYSFKHLTSRAIDKLDFSGWAEHIFSEYPKLGYKYFQKSFGKNIYPCVKSLESSLDKKEWSRIGKIIINVFASTHDISVKIYNIFNIQVCSTIFNHDKEMFDNNFLPEVESSWNDNCFLLSVAWRMVGEPELI